MRSALVLALVAAFTSMAVVFVVKTFADTAFLAAFGVAYLPHFFVAQSAALIGLSFGYSWVARTGGLALDAGILVALAAMAFAAPWLAGSATFAVALALISLSTLAQLAMWNAATAVVTGRRARVFLPRAGAAATAGAVAGGFVSSALVGLAGLDALAFTSGGLALATLGLRIALHREAEARKRPPRPAPRRAPGGRDSARQLVVLLAAGVVVESLLSAFLDFGFKREVADAFASADDIGLFFALYYGVTNVVLLATQLAWASRLLATRSLRTTLGLEPLALGAAAVAWAVAPVLALAALARGVEGVMKFGVMRPAQEVAMTPLSEAARRRHKVILRGVLGPGGAALAGLLLIAAAPLLATSDVVVPIVCAVLAAALWLVSRATAGHYLAALGSELGLRHITHHDGDAALGRDALARLVELCASEDRAAAELGRDLLRGLPSLAPLERSLGTGSVAQRRALYELLAERPTPACAAALAAAVAAEPDEGGALDAGLLALAVHGPPDGAQLLARARRLAGSFDAAALAEPRTRAAWCYLAHAGALDQPADRDLLPRVLAALMASDGKSGALAARAALGRRALTGEELDVLVDELARDPATRDQALIAAATIGRDHGVALVLRELATRAVRPDALIARLAGPALARVTEHVLDPGVPLAQRRQVLAALRTHHEPEVTALALAVLRGPEVVLRDEAVRILLARAGVEPDAFTDELEHAISAQLDRFEAYVRARPGYASAVRESQMEIRGRGGDPSAAISALSFLVDEIERCTERELGRLCALIAVLGRPEAVFDAERGLRAPTYLRRRQAVDVLQEVVRGRQKARLLELLEVYLMPPRATPDGARERVLALDPWLARCANGEAETDARRLWALRSAPLFDAIDGESLSRLAERADEVSLPGDTIVVREGEPGDALYIVIDGILAVRRGDRVVAELGPGEAFGELALLDGEPRQATVRTRRPSRLLRLPRDAFDRALSEHPELGLGLVLGLVKWLRQGKDQPRSTLRSTVL